MKATVFVSLREEGTEVWRPVAAERIRDDVYRITGTRADDTEIWEFSTGDVVRCREQCLASGEKGLVAYERVGMSRRTKRSLLIGFGVVALLVGIALGRSDVWAFVLRQSDGIRHAGTWEDDPQNWLRAFGEPLPPQVRVVHSRYWRSDHFTVEFAYFFEVEATPEWKEAFLKKHGLARVSPSDARSFRSNMHFDWTPGWFAPDPVELYEVWDKPGNAGSLWIAKTNGHVFLHDMQP